jgi:hypothetical protein
MCATPLHHRRATKSVTGRFSLFDLSAFLGFNISKIRPELKKFNHPLIEEKDIKSLTSFTCHPKKALGRFAHVAGGVGCENCHQAGWGTCKTTITPVAACGDLLRVKGGLRKAPIAQGPFLGGRG